MDSCKLRLSQSWEEGVSYIYGEPEFAVPKGFGIAKFDLKPGYADREVLQFKNTKAGSHPLSIDIERWIDGSVPAVDFDADCEFTIQTVRLWTKHYSKRQIDVAVAQFSDYRVIVVGSGSHEMLAFLALTALGELPDKMPFVLQGRSLESKTDSNAE